MDINAIKIGILKMTNNKETHLPTLLNMLKMIKSSMSNKFKNDITFIREINQLILIIENKINNQKDTPSLPLEELD